MKKSFCALLYLLLSLSPLVAQNEEAVELVNEKITALESCLLKIQNSFNEVQVNNPSFPSLEKIKRELDLNSRLIEEAKKKQSSLKEKYRQVSEKGSNSPSKKKQEEDLQLEFSSFSNSLVSIEQNLAQSEELLKEAFPNIQTGQEELPLSLDIFNHVYQESDNGYLIEVSLPVIQDSEELNAICQSWLDLAKEEMEKVKEEGKNWNKEKPGAPQYLYLCNYEQYYNRELDVLSVVAKFYEYVGEFPGKESVQSFTIKRDLHLVTLQDLFSPSQITYIQEELNRQLKEDMERSDDDIDKKYLYGSSVDFNGAALYFNKENLEVCFPTGVLNSHLGRAACLSIPVDKILQH